MTTIILLLTILFTAAWNGLIIRWHQTGKGSKSWHAVGFAIRSMLVLSVLLISGLWWAMLAGVLSWPIYNVIINLVRGLKWYYLSNEGIDGFIKKIFNKGN